MNYCTADLRSFLVDDADKVLHIRKPVDPATEAAALCSETIRPLPNNRWAVDATKPSLAEPARRDGFVRLRARGEGKVSLKDFME